MPKYYDNWQSDIFDCTGCKWRGPGSKLLLGELSSTYFELLCPECGKYVTLIMLPTFQESRANWDKLSEDERRHVEEMEHRYNEWRERKLTESTPLPDISEPSFVLNWDLQRTGDETETLIKHGETVIFREPASYEGFQRFIAVAKILRARYGSALRDLVPTKESEMYLYGDNASSPHFVENSRRLIFSHPSEKISK